ncbi:nuclear transport factor 2 family protein [Streptomyces sp. NPDC093094]|uniref:nuclear transport factor 2 family protein n=1 Tax=Streptomyces sp. NPDC093094 TaxID=3366026 RepID=UPI003808BE1B
MRHRIHVPLVLAAAVLLTGCSGSEDDADGTTSSATATQDSGAVATTEPGKTKEPDAVASNENTDGIDPAAQKYVDAVAAEDLDALVDAFHPNAELDDVGREFSGHDEIREWADNEVIGGELTVLKNTPKSDGTTLLVRFSPGGSGGFEANYVFTSRDGRIAKLELQYA